MFKWIGFTFTDKEIVLFRNFVFGNFSRTLKVVRQGIGVLAFGLIPILYTHSAFGKEHSTNHDTVTWVKTDVESDRLDFYLKMDTSSTDKRTRQFFLSLPAGEVENVVVLNTSVGQQSTPEIDTKIIEVEYKEEGLIRDLRIFSFILRSNAVNAAFPENLVLRVKFTHPVSLKKQTERPSADGNFVDLAAGLVINAPDAIPFQNPHIPHTNIGSVPASNYSVDSPQYTIPVENDGLYKFTGEDLAAAGLDLSSYRPDDLTITLNGREVDLFKKKRSKDKVNTEDIFAFYGRENESTYTIKNVYQLAFSREKKSLKPVQIEQPARIINTGFFWDKQEINNDFPPLLTKTDQFMTILDYRWVEWTWVDNETSSVPNARNFSKPGTVEFDLPGLNNSVSNSVECEFHFFSRRLTGSNFPIRFAVSLNGSDPQDMSIVSEDDLNPSLNFSSEQFKPNGNKFEIKLISPLSGAELSFDKLVVYYPRSYIMDGDGLRFRAPLSYTELKNKAGGIAPGSLQYKIKTDPAKTDLLLADTTTTDGQFLSYIRDGEYISFAHHESVPAEYLLQTLNSASTVSLEKFEAVDNLHAPTNGADILVISHWSFLDGIKPWVALKEKQGFQVKVVNLRDIYNQFDYGQETPVAIKRFLYTTLTKWEGATPHSVLLVGDATSDYRNEFREPVQNFVPSMTVGDKEKRHASDQYYACLIGNDKLADIAIGRFSVNNLDDLNSIIRKQINYETSTTTSLWTNTIGVIGDHSGFENASREVINYSRAAGYFVDSMLLSETPWIDNYYFPVELVLEKKAKVSPKATEKIRDMFNSGIGLLTYFGHGSPNVWSNERIWFGGGSPNSDVLMLTNADKLPFVINMTCNTGTFDFPRQPWNVCISEDLLRFSGGGAIACYVPSAQGITSQHEQFMAEISHRLIGTSNLPVGQALLLANWNYIIKGNPTDLPDMFHLLGDPTLRLKLQGNHPPKDLEIEPVDEHVIFELPAGFRGKAGQWQFTNFTGHTTEINHFQAEDKQIVLPKAGSAFGGLLRIASEDFSLVERYRINATGNLEIIKWEFLPGDDNLKDCAVQVFVKNKNNNKLTDFRLTLTSGNTVYYSDSVSLETGQTKGIVIQTVKAPNIVFPRLASVKNGVNIPLSDNHNIFIPPLKTEGIEDSLIINPHSVRVRYHTFAQTVNTTITFDVFNLSPKSLAPVKAELTGINGAVLGTTALPPVAGNSKASASLIVKSQDFPGNIQSFLTVMADGVTVGNKVPLNIGSDHYPDIMLHKDNIRISTSLPMDGETVFFDIPVYNGGNTVASGVELSAEYSVVGTSESLPVESKVQTRPEVIEIDPKTTAILKLRWDPFQNAGENHVFFRIKTPHVYPETRLDNNLTSLTIKFRTKFKLRISKLTMLPRDENDVKAQQIRLAAHIENHGESLAQGLGVRFYGDKAKSADQLLGEVFVDKILPGETKAVILNYKLKPTDLNRKFQFTCEAALKGSLQRISLEDN